MMTTIEEKVARREERERCGIAVRLAPQLPAEESVVGRKRIV